MLLWSLGTAREGPWVSTCPSYPEEDVWQQRLGDKWRVKCKRAEAGSGGKAIARTYAQSHPVWSGVQNMWGTSLPPVVARGAARVRSNLGLPQQNHPHKPEHPILRRQGCLAGLSHGWVLGSIL